MATIKQAVLVFGLVSSYVATAADLVRKHQLSGQIAADGHAEIFENSVDTPSRQSEKLLSPSIVRDAKRIEVGANGDAEILNDVVDTESEVSLKRLERFGTRALAESSEASLSQRTVAAVKEQQGKEQSMKMVSQNSNTDYPEDGYHPCTKNDCDGWKGISCFKDGQKCFLGNDQDGCVTEADLSTSRKGDDYIGKQKLLLNKFNGKTMKNVKGVQLWNSSNVKDDEFKGVCDVKKKTCINGLMLFACDNGQDRVLAISLHDESIVTVVEGYGCQRVTISDHRPGKLFVSTYTQILQVDLVNGNKIYEIPREGDIETKFKGMCQSDKYLFICDNAGVWRYNYKNRVKLHIKVKDRSVKNMWKKKDRAEEARDVKDSELPNFQDCAWHSKENSVYLIDRKHERIYKASSIDQKPKNVELKGVFGDLRSYTTDKNDCDPHAINWLHDQTELGVACELQTVTTFVAVNVTKSQATARTFDLGNPCFG